jgi:tetratricopeptide (TPR) repeat protein
MLTLPFYTSVVGRFWVDASTEETIEEDYHSIAKTAGLGERDCLQVVTRWLTKLSDEGTPWLLVLDNFGLKRRVEDFLPRQHTNNSCVIVTSIKKLEGPTHDDELGPLEVGPLPLKDASQLLLRAVGKENVNSIEWDACRKLVTKLGFLPLAIAVAGAHIRNNQYSLVKYLGRWQFVFSRTSSDCGKLTRSVDATLQISYNHLMASNGSDQANDLLHFFTFLHTESTSTSPLRMAWKSAHVLAVEQDVEWNSSPLNVLKAFAAQHILEPEKQFEESIRSALSLLRSYSLLQWNGSEAVQLHSLVGNWVLYRLKGANLQFWWTATATTLAMSLSSESSIEYKRSLLPHLDHLFDIQPTTLKSSLFNIHASSKRDDFEAAFRFADVYAISGYFEKALEIRKEIWSQVGREGSLDASELATSDAQLLRQLRVKTLELLAASYGDKGNHHEALGCRQRAILLEVESAPSRRSFSENYLKLKLDEAESLRLLGHEEQASAIRTHIKHELERHPQTTPEFRLRVLRVSREIELGILHQKSNQQALGRLEHLVAEHGALVEKDDHDLLTARSELSRCYSEAGYEKKALIERLDILAIRRSESDIHHDTLVAMQDVANSYSCLERKDEALGMRGSIMRILDSDETGIVESHPTFLSAKFNWARSLFDNGEVESALLAHKQVLALRQQCEQLGAGTRDTIMSMEEVAQSLFQLACDQPPSTHRLLEALSIRQDIVRMTGKSTASTETSRPWLKAKTMLAIYYHDLAKFHGAALEMLHLPSEIGRTPMDVLIYASKCLYQVFLHQRETLGESDGDTLQTMTELGIAKFRMAGCDTSNKTSHYEEALRWFQGVDLHATRDIPCNIQNLGYIVTTYKKLHRLRDAIHTLERLLQLQGETLGTDAVGTKQTARKLWEEYRSRKDDTSAQTRADSLYERYVADGMQEELKD